MSGDEIKALRRRMGNGSRDEFASRFPVNKRTVRRWENEEVTPSPLAMDKMRQIQAGLDADEDGQESRRPGSPLSSL